MPYCSFPIWNNQPILQVSITEPDKLEADDKYIENILKDTYRALIDTGATNSCITKKVAGRLNLKPLKIQSVSTPSGMTERNVYEVSIHIPITVGTQKKENIIQDTINVQSFKSICVTEIEDSDSFSVIIGMDIIQKCHLTIVGGICHFST